MIATKTTNSQARNAIQKQYGKWYLDPKNFNSQMKKFQQNAIQHINEADDITKEQLEQEKASYFLYFAHKSTKN